MITSDQFIMLIHSTMCNATSTHGPISMPTVEDEEPTMCWYWGPDMVHYYFSRLCMVTGGKAPHGISQMKYQGVPVRVMRQDGCAIKLLQKF